MKITAEKLSFTGGEAPCDHCEGWGSDQAGVPLWEVTVEDAEGAVTRTVCACDEKCAAAAALHRIFQPAGAKLVYDDGRPNHRGVKAEVVEVSRAGMTVQFDDQASPDLIRLDDGGWMKHLSVELPED